MRPEVTSRPQRLAETSSATGLSRRRLMTLAGASALGLGLATPLMAQQASSPQTAPFYSITATEAHDMAATGEIILVDIRTPEEWAETGIGEGAIALDMRTDQFVPDLVKLRRANPDTPIAMICRTGNRSQFVVSALAGQGFPGLVDVAEGMVGGRRGKGWIPTGLPVYPGTPEKVAERLAQVMPQDP